MQSIEAYENALALYPDDSASRNNVALEYNELERYEDSIAHFEELLRRGLPFLPVYLNAAMAYVSNGECERGHELIRDFVRRQPDWHFGYEELARVSMSCGRLDEALAALGTYEESIEAGAPTRALDGNQRFFLHILADEFDQALAANEKLADSISPLARYLVYPGNRLMVAGYHGDYTEEMAAMIELAASVPDEASGKATLLSFIALRYLEIGEPEQALAFADRARPLTRVLTENAYLAAVTAVAQARAGRSVAARTAAQQHQRLSAQLPNPWARRRELLVAAEIALAQDDIEQAIDHLRAAHGLLQPGPNYPPFDELVEYSYALGAAHYAAGNRVEAVELFRTITESGSQRLYHPFEYVRSFYFLGKIAEEDGDNVAARRHYRRFLDYWGDGEIDRERVDEARAFVNGN
jgi:tetratricopeptide (TPR) repeat protein